jgi:hypothetical protein
MKEVRKSRLGKGMEDVMEGIANPAPSLSAEVSNKDRHTKLQFVLAQSHGRYLDKVAMALEDAGESTFDRSKVLRAMLEGLARAKPTPDVDLSGFLGVTTEEQLAERFRLLFKEGVTA